MTGAPGRGVAVTAAFTDAALDRLRSEVPGVRTAPELFGEQRWVADHAGSGRVPDGLAELVGDAEVAFGIPADSADGLRALAGCPSLRWVQATAAGAAGTVREAGDLGNLVVTTGAGVHGQGLAEFALAGVLHHTRGVPRLLADSAARTWPSRRPHRELTDLRALVLGLGAVGTRTARLLAACGVQVTGVRHDLSKPTPDGVDAVHPLDQVARLATRADLLVITLPGGPATDGLVDAEVLAALPDGAVVVNVGRGTVLDTGALLAGLDASHLAGAALDVTDPEPIPEDSPLWDRADVLLSPHTAALSAHEDDRLVSVFLAQLGRYRRGEQLEHVVDLG